MQLLRLSIYYVSFFLQKLDLPWRMLYIVHVLKHADFEKESNNAQVLHGALNGFFAAIRLHQTVFF